MTHVMACIDGSPSAPVVCDYAGWASEKLQAPLILLHVLDSGHYPVPGNLSGNIGLGSREHLLDELAELDARRSKLALDEGRIMLEAAKERLAQAGSDVAPLVRQRHGKLVDTLVELSADIRLLVIGRQGEDSKALKQQIGSQLESVIRTLHRPVLVAPAQFKRPRSAIIAYDGSPTMRAAIQLIGSSPLLAGMPLHLVMAGANTKDAHEALSQASQILQKAGHEVHVCIRGGDVEPVLHAYQVEHSIDLLVMGAYGHSRIREFFVGSTTTRMLCTTETPLLLLR